MNPIRNKLNRECSVLGEELHGCGTIGGAAATDAGVATYEQEVAAVRAIGCRVTSVASVTIVTSVASIASVASIEDLSEQNTILSLIS